LYDNFDRDAIYLADDDQIAITMRGSINSTSSRDLPYGVQNIII
jgi:hypothetical protein